MRLAAVLLAISLLFTVATARNWYVVPDGTGDAPTIQAGIDSAAGGDEVILADGTFMGEGNREIDFLGKAITVRSQNGNPSLCIIDCENTGRGVSFVSSEGSASILKGITIRRGSAPGGEPEGGGGGIYCNSSSPSIVDCCLSDN